MAETKDTRAVARAPRPCASCGVMFTPRRPGGKAKRAGTRWGVYCGKSCQTIGQKRPLKPAEPKPIAQCSVCSSAFSMKTRLQKTCSPGCRAEAERRRAFEQNSLRKQTFARPCKECGVTFTPVYSVKLRMFCSETCRRRASRRIGKQLRRARKRGTNAEAVNALKVFERDGWRCHICARKTQPSKRGTYHPRAPELDHIVPLAKGGEHTYANTACACRECNGTKGATIYGQPNLLSCAAP